MKDLSELSHEDFEPFLNDAFRVTLEDGDGPDFELIQVKPYGERDPEAKTRQPFSLLFRGPLEPAFEQQMFSLENAKLGEITLFLIPVGPDDDGMLYDATFN